ncbi:MAG: hypothetical protein M3512_18800 [Bacteroidota bacterium]|nr:hypothetical protein [Bacteroidota bacterium]
MEQFTEKYKDHLYGILHGFDRMIFKGFIGNFLFNNNFYYFLSQEDVRLTGFKEYVLKINKKIKGHIDQIIEQAGCPWQYLQSAGVSKESLAKKIQKEKGITEGLICVLSCVEPCYCLSIEYNGKTKKLEKSTRLRKCLHYYLYYQDREFGFMHVRLQTWFPFNIQIYINGKEYLKKQLDKEGVAYTYYNNSITWVADLERAQFICDKFQEKKWAPMFDRFAEQLNCCLPRIKELFGGSGYKWMIEESEYASDILYKSREGLERYYPYFIEYASLCQMGTNIYTFFGRKLPSLCKGETVSDRKYFWNQGFRVKFTLDQNSIKMYDKDTVLRIETTINNSNAFSIRNPNPLGRKKWVPMGKSISNLYRYAQVAKACNMRYINSLMSVDRENTLDNKIENLCNGVEANLSTRAGSKPRKYPSLNPLNEFYSAVFNTVLNGSFKIRGFSNKNLRLILTEQGFFPKQYTENIKKTSGKVTRLIAKLRAHKLVQKLPHTCRYRITATGEKILSRILMFKKMDFRFC